MQLFEMSILFEHSRIVCYLRTCPCSSFICFIVHVKALKIVKTVLIYRTIRYFKCPYKLLLMKDEYLYDDIDFYVFSLIRRIFPSYEIYEKTGNVEINLDVITCSKVRDLVGFQIY